MKEREEKARINTALLSKLGFFSLRHPNVPNALDDQSSRVQLLIETMQPMHIPLRLSAHCP